MAKPLDSRIINKAILECVHFSPAVKLSNPDPESPNTYWGIQVIIDYVLVDTDLNKLGRRSITHQEGFGETRPTLVQSRQLYQTNLAGWVTADRLAIADSDTD